MTNDEAYAIGARALAAGFKWMPGCLGVDSREGFREVVYICPDYDGKPMFCRLFPSAGTDPYDTQAPDVRDCGVIAHMLAQVRERAGSSFYLWRDAVKDAWEVRSDTPSYLVSGVVGTHAKTQGEALVLALEITHRGGF